MSFAPRTLLAAFLVAGLALISFATAQVCQPDLWASLSSDARDRPPTGIDAARLLKRAVDIVEPALPPLQGVGELPLPTDHPDYRVVRFLAERKLLPDGWQPDELEAGSWSTMLKRFAAWYELPQVSRELPATTTDLVVQLSSLLAEVSNAIRPAALLATDPNDRNRTTFWAIIWNWTVYPRLLVVKPDASLERSTPRDVMPRLSNCAVSVSAYISAPEETAKSLFLTHNDSRMYVVASEPQRPNSWPYEVPGGDELDAFVYRLAGLEGVNVYAAVFDGPDVGLVTLLGMMSRVRTNISPLALSRYLQTP